MDDELHFILRREAVSPKMVRIFRSPRPRTLEIPQHARAASLDGGRGDACHLDDVVGHQAMAAGNEFEGELGLADAGIAGNQGPHAQHVHEHAVQAGGIGQPPG